MASVRETALTALRDIIAAALPFAAVVRSTALPQEITDAGYVAVMDGDAGDPEVTLSPFTNHYTHLAEVGVVVTGIDLDIRLDSMLKDIGMAIAANTTLTGTVERATPTAPVFDALETENIGAKSALMRVELEYSVDGNNPLN